MKTDPKPEINRLEELVLKVRSGEIKLPKFQRQFVWKESDVVKLFDSIYNGYPIGSLLLWNSSQKLTSEREILGVKINKAKSIRYPTNYLLDGQQRLTSLCGALFWDGSSETNKWNIGFNLESESFHLMRQDPKGIFFPLNKLLNTRDFLLQCNEYLGLDNYQEIIEKAEKLLRSIKDYKLAVVIIGDMTVEEVAPIFERINSTGRKLTIVDLMMAATWSNEFDLNAEIASIQVDCAKLGYSELPPKIILRSIATAANLGINKDDIQKLRKFDPQQLVSISRKTRRSIVSAVRFFTEELEVHDFSYIPYALQFNYVVEFFNGNSSPSKSQLDELRAWIWFTSATRYFGTSNSGQNAKDLEKVRAYSRGDIGELFVRESVDISRLLYDKFNLRNATSTSFALILGTTLPELAADGRVFDKSYKYVKNSKFYASAVPEENDFSKLNVSMVVHPFASEKVVKAMDIDLSDHFLDEASLRMLKKQDIAGFIEKRSQFIAGFVQSVTGCEVTFSIPPFGEGQSRLSENLVFESEDDEQDRDDEL